MTQNMGNTDRIIRAILGVAIIVVAFYTSMWLAVIGVILLATAAVGWCPLYMPFGFSTRPADETQAK